MTINPTDYITSLAEFISVNIRIPIVSSIEGVIPIFHAITTLWNVESNVNTKLYASFMLHV